MECKLLLNQHVESVFQFEKSRLSAELSEIETEMHSWQQPWRMESLQHYAELGWSFIALKENAIQGYVLGQPLLFYNNWTQSLWVEHLAYLNDDVAFELMDVMIRWAKSKHLQKVLLNGEKDWTQTTKKLFNQFQKGEYLHMSTTKMSEK